MTDPSQQSPRPRGSVATLLAALGAANIETRTRFEPDDAERIAIQIPRPARDRARSAAISAGMKPLRLESRSTGRHGTEVLVSQRDDVPSLTTTTLCFDRGSASFEEIRGEGELSTGGIAIAISGGDGAGKTTAVQMLHAWLSEIFRVELFHFGRPRPLLVSSLVYRSFGILRRFGIDVPLPMVVSEGGGARLGVWARITLAVQLLCLARDRRSVHAKSRIAVGSGSIVLCDRYRDARISDMEGPRLQNLWASPNAWQRRWMRFERRCYEGFVKPDAHLILRVSPEVARERQPTDDPEALRRRVEAVALACESAPDDVIIVDADAPIDVVHRELRRLVWDAL